MYRSERTLGSVVPLQTQEPELSSPGAVPSPEPRPSHLGEVPMADPVGPPMDLVQFVQSGGLASVYSNPASARASVELMPPI